MESREPTFNFMIKLLTIIIEENDCEVSSDKDEIIVDGNKNQVTVKGLQY